MSVRNTWQVGHTTAFLPHYFMPEGQFYAKRFLSVTGSHLWCCSNAMGLPASLLVRRPHCDRTIAPLGAEACQWLFSFPLAKCLTMRHPKLPKKLYNRLIINLGNLFVQKCDEVKTGHKPYKPTLFVVSSDDKPTIFMMVNQDVSYWGIKQSL